jgi:hypothetical protein
VQALCSILLRYIRIHAPLDVEVQLRVKIIVRMRSPQLEKWLSKPKYRCVCFYIYSYVCIDWPAHMHSLSVCASMRLGKVTDEWNRSMYLVFLAFRHVPDSVPGSC